MSSLYFSRVKIRSSAREGKRKEADQTNPSSNLTGSTALSDLPPAIANQRATDMQTAAAGLSLDEENTNPQILQPKSGSKDEPINLLSPSPKKATRKETPETPNGLKCGITQELMFDPVMAEDGMTYERAAIVEWLKNHDTSPIIPSIKISLAGLRRNVGLRSGIDRYVASDAIKPETKASYKASCDEARTEKLFEEGKIEEAAKFGHPKAVKALGLLAK